ncbi:MAG: hypothetical protein H8F28_15690 [Fibrella sp.]|nr:hypothetical protein [Armatimonadota bacterium]
MSSGSSNSGIPSGLAPIGGWKPGDSPATPAPLSPPPAPPAQPPTPSPATRSEMGGVGTDTLPLAPPPPLLTPPPASTRPSRFDAPPPAPAGAPRSRFDSLPPAATGGAVPASRFAAPPAAPAPKLATPEPQRDRAYSVAGAYNKYEVPEMSSNQMVAGIASGVVVGGICTALWIFIFISTSFTWSTLIAPGVGYAIGWAVFMASKYGEETSCWIAGIISAVYCLIGVGTIQFLIYSWFGFPSITGLFFGVIALGLGAERGYRTPEIMAVHTAV